MSWTQNFNKKDKYMDEKINKYHIQRQYTSAVIKKQYKNRKIIKYII